jgi:RNA polymerase sigma-70 factor (family 1)
MFQTLEDLPDNLLLRQCKGGSEAAFNVLFRRYFDDLLQFAARQLKDHELAEELVMDLMLKLWQQNPDTADIQDLGPYLFRSVKNSIISQWRKKTLAFFPVEDLAESSEPPGRSADYHMLDAEAAAIYQDKLAGLSPQRRLVYTLSREQEMTHAEIASETNLSVHTVKNHLKAALKYFRENLKRYAEASFILLFFILF